MEETCRIAPESKARSHPDMQWGPTDSRGDSILVTRVERPSMTFWGGRGCQAEAGPITVSNSSGPREARKSQGELTPVLLALVAQGLEHP